MTKQLPLATVTFEGDFRLTVLQALSIDRLYHLDTLAEYTIVLNGADNERLRDEFFRVLEKSASSEMLQKTRIIEWADIFPRVERVGFYDQQAIKLGLSRYYPTSHYILLDGKNHFVAPANVETFFHEGKPRAPRQKVSSYWRPYLDASIAAMDAPTEGVAWRMMPSITPFVMNTTETAKVVEHLEAKFQTSLPQAMVEAHPATEFLMYYAHLAATGADVEYADEPMPVKTLFTKWPQDPELVASIIGKLGPEFPIFGLHRNRLPQLTSTQKEAIGEVWRRQLLLPWESSEWFFTSS